MSAVWNHNAQCPERGPALAHIFDRRHRADGGCLYCGFGAVQNFCKSIGCVNQTIGTFCEECLTTRGHSAFSHIVEGHSEKILGCPPCEEGRP